ncbi:hypothetical protein [Dysgonomonas sp. HGC4]|nr:hypothetical protein [Dysgonomonas sp. HGC4]
MKFFEKLGLVTHNPFHFYIIRFDKSDRISLLEEEVDAIWQK